MRGSLVRYQLFKGFGFIRPEGGGRDVFVHASELPLDIREGLRMETITLPVAVTYEPAAGDRGSYARNVRQWISIPGGLVQVPVDPDGGTADEPYWVRVSHRLKNHSLWFRSNEANTGLTWDGLRKDRRYFAWSDPGGPKDAGEAFLY